MRGIMRLLMSAPPPAPFPPFRQCDRFCLDQEAAHSPSGEDAWGTTMGFPAIWASVFLSHNLQWEEPPSLPFLTHPPAGQQPLPRPHPRVCRQRVLEGGGRLQAANPGNDQVRYFGGEVSLCFIF